MSLLLDALKKAAEDKKKSSSEPAEPTETDATLDIDQDDELELELDETVVDSSALNIETIDNNDVNESDVDSPIHEAEGAIDELPTLSEELSRPVIEEPSVADLISRKIDDTESAIIIEELEPEKKPGDEPAEQKAINEKPQANKEAAQVVEEKTIPEKSEIKNQTSTISSQQALDMMINKSREATHRKEKNIRNIGIVVLILMLVIGGSYFYFDAEQQVAELEQSNKALLSQLQQSKPLTSSVALNTEPKQVIKETVPAVQAPVVEQAATRQVSQSVVKKPTGQSKPIQISKTVAEDPVDDLLTRAYERFNAEDYDGANRLYVRVLEREAKNRDALLGSAAVAIKQQRYEYARQKYKALLVLDPKDSMARAGLAAIENDQSNESRLKFMLREQPEASHLYFALGSLYASEQRWPEAQQAFFSAWSGEPNNPDYAYNLAISLDQMAKHEQAIQIYQTAIKLSKNKPVEFSVDDISARIDQLGKTSNE